MLMKLGKGSAKTKAVVAGPHILDPVIQGVKISFRGYVG